jgi:hypothetical protein
VDGGVAADGVVGGACDQHELAVGEGAAAAGAVGADNRVLADELDRGRGLDEELEPAPR